jgi:neutral ceramidase
MKRAHWFCSLAVLMLLGCASPRPVIVTAPVSHEPRVAQEFMAGVARVDVTPAPGVSTFAFAPEATVTEGYWTRLYCRVFVLKPATGLPLAIVPCDLAAISVALHHRVAEKVQEVVPRARILLTATHTAAGPAHYFESAALAGKAHPSVAGFEPAMLETLASRIAEGIHHANNRLRPAQLRWAFNDVSRLTRNRSLAAYLANSPNYSASHRASVPPQVPEEEHAIDPMLASLQIEEVAPASRERVGPLGWLVFYAMRPVAIRGPNPLLGGDVFGVTSRAIEAKLRPIRARNDPRCTRVASGRLQCPNLVDFDPLVGLINTNSADLVPVTSVGNTQEAIIIGNRLADRAFSNYNPAAKFNDKVLIDARYLEVDLPGACLLHGSSLCASGQLGPGIWLRGLGGGHFGEVQPLDNERDDCQAPKSVMPSLGNALLLGQQPARFPEHASFGLVRVDDTWISFVPADVTVHAGWAMRQRVEQVVQTKEKAPQRYLIASMANGFVETIASRAEYNLQFVEGASTLYGPQTAEFASERLEILARSLLGQEADKWLAKGQPPIDAIVKMPFEFGPQSEIMTRPTGPRLAHMVGRIDLDLCRVRISAERDGICFNWRDAAPGRGSLGNPDAEPWLELISAEDQRPVPSCVLKGKALECDPLLSIDDRGIAFSTRVHGRDGDGYLWSTLVQPSTQEWSYLKQAGKVRVRVRGDSSAASVESPTFSPADLPLCSDKLLRQCIGN